MATYTFDPKSVSVIVGGSVIDGFSAGTFLSVERNDDMWKLTVGCDGVASRAKSNNRSGRITITLQQTSRGNDVLSALALSDELANSGAVPILIRDGSGRTVVSGLTSWITKFAPAEFGQEIADRAWVLECDILNIFLGGN